MPDRARRELGGYYPTYADFVPIKKGHSTYEHQPMRLVPPTEDGTPDSYSLNADFTDEYLADNRNPRWVEKPVVAYLWGADGNLQELSCDRAAPQNSMVVQEDQKADPAWDGAQCGSYWRCFQR